MNTRQSVNRFVGLSIATFSWLFIFLALVLPAKAFGSVIYNQLINSAPSSLLLANEETQHQNITGITGTIKAIVYKPVDGLCYPNNRRPSLEKNGSNTGGGTAFNDSFATTTDGNCRYVWTAGVTAISTDVFTIDFGNSVNAFGVFGYNGTGKGTLKKWNFVNNTYTADSNVNQLSFAFCDDVNCEPPSSGVTGGFTGTQFISVAPADNSTLINPNVLVSAVWTISDEDLERLRTFWSSSIDGKIILTANICGVNPQFCTGAMSWFLPTGLETATSTTISFTGSFDRRLVYGKDYVANFHLTASTYGVNAFGYRLSLASTWSISTTTYFSVGTTTNSGHVRQAISSTTESLLSSYIFASGYSLNACNPLSSDWNITDCVLSLVKPDPDFYTGAVDSLKTGFLSKAPMGYATRFYSIMSATTTTNLPTFTVPIRIGQATSTASGTMYLTYDMNDMVAGANNVLTETRDPYNNKNIRDIAEPIVQVLIGSTLVFAIIKDLLGSHRHSQHDVAIRR